ncbi:MAG: hypothetical protein H6849_03805 [Alphaproteobacteria bacterium]|nr:MAG: hypothetical protein H6849_03805 [Alphaproteobacteria bacterium]
MKKIISGTYVSLFFAANATLLLSHVWGSDQRAANPEAPETVVPGLSGMGYTAPPDSGLLEQPHVDVAARLLTPDRSSYERWMDNVYHARTFLGIEARGADVSRLVRILSGLPPGSVEGCIAHAGSLTTEDMTPSNRVEVMRILSGIQPLHRDDFVAKIWRLYPRLEKEEHVMHALLTTHRLYSPHAQMSNVDDFINMIEGIRLDGESREEAMAILLERSHDERKSRVARVYEYVGLSPWHHGYATRVLDILRSPVGQNILPPQERLIDMAADGIDVHVLGRDSATKRAYELVWDHQRGLTEEAISTSYGNFLETMELLEESRQTMLLQALGLMRAVGQSFGGLLDIEDKITSLDINMSPHEFLGRLWHFALHYRDPRGGTVAEQKEAFLSGLIDAIESDGHRVCVAGQLQRLAVSLFQGRLPGVDIDGLDAMQVATEVKSVCVTPADTAIIVLGAWTAYQEGLRHTATAVDLERFAHEYRVQNPGIHPDSFAETLIELRDRLHREM